MILRYYGSTQVYAYSFQIVILVAFFLISPLLRFYREFLAVVIDVEQTEITGFFDNFSPFNLFFLNNLLAMTPLFSMDE